MADQSVRTESQLDHELAGTIEMRSIQHVPETERQGRPWHLATIWFMANAHIATLAVGLIGPLIGASFLTSISGIVAGVLCGTFFMAFHSAQGPRLGLPQMIQSRAQFGYLGVLLPMALVVFMVLGFNVFNLKIFSQTLTMTTSAPEQAGHVIAATAALVLAAVGYRWIHAAERYLTFAFVGLFGLLTIAAATQVDLPPETAGGFAWTPFLVMFGITAGYQLAWAPYVSDYSRYLPVDVGHRAPLWWTYVGSAAGAIWLMGLGAYLGAAFPMDESLSSVRTAGDLLFDGFGGFVLLCALLGLIGVCTINLYTGGLTLLSMADAVVRVPARASVRFAVMAAATVLVLVAAYASSDDFLVDFHSFLLLLLYTMIPWTAVNLVDYYIVRRGRYNIAALTDGPTVYGRWNPKGLVAYAAGFLASVPFFSVHGLYVGPVAAKIDEADIALFVGLPVSAAVYLLMSRGTDVRAELSQARVPTSPR